MTGAVAHLAVYNLDGSVGYQHDYPVTAAPDVATSLGAVDLPATLSSVYFLKLELRDATGKMLSDNFYWRAQAEHQDDLTDLGSCLWLTLRLGRSRGCGWQGAGDGDSA